MSQIMLKPQKSIATVVSNVFIDSYLTILNEAQIRIYLYLLRHLNDNTSVSVADIADFFNYTERDVMRALSFMSRLGLILVEYDARDNIVSIAVPRYIEAATDDYSVRGCFPGDYADITGSRVNPDYLYGADTGRLSSDRLSPSAAAKDRLADTWKDRQADTGIDLRADAGKDRQADAGKDRFFDAGKDRQAVDAGKDRPTGSGIDRPADTGEDFQADAPVIATDATADHFYPADVVSAFKDREDARQLIFLTEMHLGRNLSLSETNTLLFIFNELNFSIELMEYLVEYCVNCGKKNLRYIEKVAISWAERGISTIEQAKNNVGSPYYRECYSMLRALGITSRSVVRSDIDYLTKWLDVYGVDMDVVLEACRRNISSINVPRFNYIDSILKRWSDAGVRHIPDIEKADADHRERSRKTAGNRAPVSSNNKFKNFKESGRDFNSVVDKLRATQAPL